MDYSLASAVLGNAMYVMGGIQSSPSMRLDQVWKSTNRGVTWTQTTNATDPKFPARMQHSAAAVGSIVQRRVENHRRRAKLGERSQESLKDTQNFLHLKPISVSDEDNSNQGFVMSLRGMSVRSLPDRYRLNLS